MLKLKLQYRDNLMRRADSLEEPLMLGKTGQEEKGTTEDDTVGWHRRLSSVHSLSRVPLFGTP